MRPDHILHLLAGLGIAAIFGLGVAPWFGLVLGVLAGAGAAWGVS